MIKANEVRIGNYFMDTSFCIDYEDVNQISKSDFEDNEFMWDRKFPIQLTHKWLIDFGFEYSKGCSESTYYKNGIIMHEVGLSLQLLDYDIHIEYVHQLQNIYFALTGEELDYSL